MPLVFVDVNKVPGSVVYSNGIRKMPTIAVRASTLLEAVPTLPSFSHLCAWPSMAHKASIPLVTVLQVYRGGKKVAEHIAAEGGLNALEKARLLA